MFTCLGDFVPEINIKRCSHLRYFREPICPLQMGKLCSFTPAEGLDALVMSI